MGTWGANNFDNDGATDFFLDEIQGPLIAHIERIFDDPSALDLDEEGETVFMPCIDLLATLVATYRINRNRLPDLETVAGWRNIYLTSYDEYIDQLEPTPDFKVERRRIIAATFDRLQEGLTNSGH